MMIRRAREEDIPALQSLLGQVLEVHHEARPDIFKAKGSKFSDPQLRHLLRDDHKPIFVYEDEAGRVLGHLFLIIEERDSAIFEPRKTLFIDDLCVDEAARGLKIGQKLYQFALDFAKEQDCYNMTLHVWNANAGAYRFYEKRGMTPQYTQMEVLLED